MHLLYFIVVLVFGLAFGSFANVLIYRLPKGVGFWRGRSYCPRCKKKIEWKDNIPLVSYLLLGGKCRKCRKPISYYYPLVEMTTTGLFGLVYYFWDSCTTGLVCDWKGWLGVMSLPYLLLVVAALVVVFFIDLKHQIILDEVSFFLLSLTFVLIVLAHIPELYLYILSGFGFALFLLLLHLLTKGKGMGLGDVKFVLFGGLLLGWPGVVAWFYVSFLTGAVVGIMLIIMGKVKLHKPVAFGPFLVFGLLVSMFWGEKLLGIMNLI